MGRLISKLPDRIKHISSEYFHALSIRLFPSRWYSEQPPDFLIIGLQKCGTYWLTALLDSHPEIRCFPPRPSYAAEVGEGHFFDILARVDTDMASFKQSMMWKHQGFFRDLAKSADNMSREQIHDLFHRRYNAFVQKQRQGKNIVGEKTTEYVFHLDMIESMYPALKKICILRDPRDRVVSFHFHQLRKGRLSHPDIQMWEVEDYCERMEKEFASLVNFPGDIEFLTYEDLSGQTEDMVKKLLIYLEAEYSDEIIAEMICRSTFEALSGRSQEITDKNSHFRKGIVGDWQHHLTPTMQSYITSRILQPWLPKLKKRTGLDLLEYAAN